MRGLFAGLWPVCRKEFVHMMRDRTTVFFAFLLPVLQMVIFGFAIDTNVRRVPTVVLDHAKTQESRRMIERLVNSDVFDVRFGAANEREIYELIVAGKARVGIQIPPDYSRRLLAGQQAYVQVLVDGSDSNVTSQAVSTANGVVLQESIQKMLGRNPKPPIEARPAVLFNPALRSANFFVPGMIAILMQIMVVMLTAFSIVRERERGTLDQLWLTPVAPLGLMVGKMIPYGCLAFAELIVILTVMRVVFGVPIHGSLGLLLAMGTALPSVFLSGYIFLIENMPWPFQMLSKVVPATYFIAVLRGIILRGAGWAQLWPQAAALTMMGAGAVLLAARRFARGNV